MRAIPTAGLSLAISLISLSATAENKPPVPPHFMDRLASFEPLPDHVIIQRGYEGERFNLVTLPEGQTMDNWSSRFTISIEPPFESVSDKGIGWLIAVAERPYEESCPPEDRFYDVGSLTYMVDDHHPSRTLVIGCGRQETSSGPVRELSYSRLIAGPQGGFIVQWSERTEPQGSISYVELNQMRERMDHLDPFGGHAVREAIRAAEDEAFEHALR